MGATPTRAAISRRLSLPSSQLGDQGGAGHGADAAGRAQQLVELGVVRLHVSHHLRFDLVELLPDGLDHGLDARAHQGDGELQALAFGQQHAQQLASTRDHSRQGLLLLVCQGTDEAGQVVAAHERGGELGQHARIDRIGLGKAPHRLGEVACLTRVDHGHGQARSLQRAGKRRLIATGGLHHHQRHVQRFKAVASAE